MRNIKAQENIISEEENKAIDAAIDRALSVGAFPTPKGEMFIYAQNGYYFAYSDNADITGLREWDEQYASYLNISENQENGWLLNQEQVGRLRNAQAQASMRTSTREKQLQQLRAKLKKDNKIAKELGISDEDITPTKYVHFGKVSDILIEFENGLYDTLKNNPRVEDICFPAFWADDFFETDKYSKLGVYQLVDDTIKDFIIQKKHGNDMEVDAMPFVSLLHHGSNGTKRSDDFTVFFDVVNGAQRCVFKISNLRGLMIWAFYMHFNNNHKKGLGLGFCPECGHAFVPVRTRMYCGKLCTNAAAEKNKSELRACYDAEKKNVRTRKNSMRDSVEYAGEYMTLGVVIQNEYDTWCKEVEKIYEEQKRLREIFLHNHSTIEEMDVEKYLAEIEGAISAQELRKHMRTNWNNRKANIK